MSFYSEKHPKMEKRQPFDFGGSSRSGKRASSPREKHSQIDKREPFDYGGHSRTGKRTSGQGNVVSQGEFSNHCGMLVKMAETCICS